MYGGGYFVFLLDMLLNVCLGRQTASVRFKRTVIHFLCFFENKNLVKVCNLAFPVLPSSRGTEILN